MWYVKKFLTCHIWTRQETASGRREPAASIFFFSFLFPSSNFSFFLLPHTPAPFLLVFLNFKFFPPFSFFFLLLYSFSHASPACSFASYFLINPSSRTLQHLPYSCLSWHATTSDSSPPIKPLFVEMGVDHVQRRLQQPSYRYVCVCVYIYSSSHAHLPCLLLKQKKRREGTCERRGEKVKKKEK